MANYNNLKDAIKQVIKQNGNQEITGNVLQNSLISIINSLGNGYQFMGVAVPSTNPGMSDQKKFYIATENGVYTNFGGISVVDTSILYNGDDDNWGKISLQNTLINIGKEGVASGSCTLKEIIENVPQEDRCAGKIVLYRNSEDNDKFYMAVFPDDAYLSGWTDESRWFIMRLQDLQSASNGSITAEKIADKAITAEKIADKAITAEKIADKAITAEKTIYDDANTKLDSENVQGAIDNIVKKMYAGGIININDRYGVDPNTTYTVETAIAQIPSYEKTWIKGILFHKENTQRETLAFCMGNSKSFFDDPDAWLEIDIRDITSITNYVKFTKYGTYNQGLSLSELIAKIPEQERFPGKMVVFKNTKDEFCLAIFCKDAFMSDWTNENNWTVVRLQDLDDFVTLSTLNSELDKKVDKIQGKGLSTNDFTNEDKNKLDSLEPIDIPEEIIQEAVDKYVAENDASLVLKDYGLNVVDNYTYKVEENVLTTPKTIGNGWSGSMESGFTHTSGSTEIIEFDISSVPTGSKILIRFDATGVTSESEDILVSVGDNPKIKSYNGNTVFYAGAIYSGGTLKFTPGRSFNGTLSNIKCNVISDSGSETVNVNQELIYNKRGNLVYGYWNVLMGGSYTARNAQDITRSIAIGNYALGSIIAGNRNVAIGTFALPNITEGENNVAIGSDTIYPLTKANNCIGIGKGVLGGNDDAENCIALGVGAMGAWSLSGSRLQCVAIGVDAGPSLKENCTHIGHRAGANVIGKNNTSVGYNSMCVGSRSAADIIGEELVCIGYKSEIANTEEAKAAVNSTAIGANTTITKSNQVIIGNDAVEEILIAGKKIIFSADGTVKWESITQ